MNRKTSLFLVTAICCGLSSLALAAPPEESVSTHIHSALRPAGEDWNVTRARYKKRLKTARRPVAPVAAPLNQMANTPVAQGTQEVAVDGMSNLVDAPAGSALAMAKPYQEGFDFEKKFPTIQINDWSIYDTIGIPNWNDEVDGARYPDAKDSLHKIFDKYRDLWSLTDPDPTHLDSDGNPLKRRPSWIYGNDGCFMRAAWMGQNLQGAGILRPSKVFVFGNLNIATNHDPRHTIHWWYHVVGLIKYGNQIYALDPAIQDSEPMKVADWVNIMTTPEERAGNKVLAVACDPGTYYPNRKCELGGDKFVESRSEITQDQNEFFASEWKRLSVLGKTPAEITQMLDAPVTTLITADSVIPALTAPTKN